VLKQTRLEPAGTEGALFPARAVEGYGLDAYRAAERRSARALAQQMEAYLRQTPALSHPRGVYPEVHSVVAKGSCLSSSGAPAALPSLETSLYLAFWPARHIDISPSGAPKRKATAEFISYRVGVNSCQFLMMPAWGHDAEGQFGGAELQGEFLGYPVVNGYMVVTRDAPLQLRPVSYERALKAYVRANADAREMTYVPFHEHAVAALKSKLSPSTREMNERRVEQFTRMKGAAEGEKLRQSLAKIDALEESRLRADVAVMDDDRRFAPLQQLRKAQRLLASLPPDQLNAPAFLDGLGNSELQLPLGAAAPQSTPLWALDRPAGSGEPPFDVVINLLDLAQTIDRFRDAEQSGTYLNLLRQTDWQAFAQRFLGPTSAR
jgi:hypothetical protein